MEKSDLKKEELMLAHSSKAHHGGERHESWSLRPLVTVYLPSGSRERWMLVLRPLSLLTCIVPVIIIIISIIIVVIIISIIIIGACSHIMYMPSYLCGGLKIHS